MKFGIYVLLSLLLFAKPFKVASYNVENLFDARYQGSEYQEYIPGKHNWSRRMVEIKLNHIAEVICDLDADILGLQEIENENIFHQLIRRLNQVGCGYKYNAITHKKNAPIQIALLSRYPISKQKEIQVSYAPRVRNILEVEIKVQGKPLSIFVNHWKSKTHRGYESKRIQYAQALEKRIANRASNKEYIILGDFDSNYDASYVLSPKLNDTHGRIALKDVLHTIAEESDMVKVKKGVHYTLWQELAFDERWSHKYYGKKSTLDHIILPHNMFDAKGIDYVNDSFGVYKTSYLLTKRGYINAWRYKNGKHMAKGYSDHLPIYAYFDTCAYVPKKTKNISSHIKEKTIEYFYEVKILQNQIKLNNATVIYKRGHHAVIKQNPSGRGIYLYGCAGKLKEGHRYDLVVQDIKSYKGLKEIVHCYIVKEKPKVMYAGYYRYKDDLKDKNLKQNEVVKDIIGLYKNHFFNINGQKFSIYFRKKDVMPKNGVKLKIHYAHLGYYKKLQLVLYSPKDFTVLE